MAVTVQGAYSDAFGLRDIRKSWRRSVEELLSLGLRVFLAGGEPMLLNLNDIRARRDTMVAGIIWRPPDMGSRLI